MKPSELKSSFESMDLKDQIECLWEYIASQAQNSDVMFWHWFSENYEVVES